MKRIVYIGDLHGNFEHIRWWLKQGHHINTTLVQVGDFGIGFKPKQEEKSLERLNEELKNRECFLLVIRGNHDNPLYFDGNHDYEFIKFLPDYSEMEIDDLNHLFVGGALSVDRKLRTENVDYWVDEGFVFDEEKIKTFKNIDVVVTHNAPNYVSPLVKSGILNYYGEKDTTLLEEVQKERDQITEMFDIINKNNTLKYHFYGHFHDNDKTNINGCKHIMLGIGEFVNPYLYD